MPDYVDHQLVLYHDIKTAGFQLGAGGTVVPIDVDYARGSLPSPIGVGQSLKITPTVYDDQARSKTHSFANCTSAILYALPIGSPAAATTLATASVPATPVFVVAKDLILEEWASWSDGVRLWFEFIDTDSKLRLWQDVTIESMIAASSATTYPETEDIAITNQDVSGAAAVTVPAVAGGMKRVRLDMSAGNFALTLYSAAHAKAGELQIVIVKGTGTCSVTPAGVETINGVAGVQTLQGIGANMTIIPYSSNWILLNPSLGVD